MVLTRFLYSIFYLEIIPPPLGPLRGSGVGTNRGLGFYFWTFRFRTAAICFTLWTFAVGFGVGVRVWGVAAHIGGQATPLTPLGLEDLLKVATLLGVGFGVSLKVCKGCGFSAWGVNSLGV